MSHRVISVLSTLFMFPLLLLSQQSDWVQQSPPAIGYDLNDIHMFSTTTAIAVGNGGKIIRTTDGGTSWTSLSSGTSNSLYRISFLDQNTGWIVGYDGTLRKTTDGGNTWVAQSSGVSSYVSLTAIHFIDASTGWLIASDNKIRKTTDGGTSWVVQYTVTATYVSLGDVHFFNANVGLVVGYSMGSGEIFRTTDGGQTWSSVDKGNSWFTRVCFINDQVGWASGITASTISYSSGDPFGGGGGISIYGQRSTVWKTTDGGVTWASGVFPTSNWLYNAYFLDTNNGWLLGASGLIFKTTDGGTNWTSQTSPLGTGHALQGIRLSGSSGWIVGTGGEILRTTNNGTNWSFQSGAGTTKDVNALYFLDSSTGWAAASSGVTMKTTDGGATWKSMQTGYTWANNLSIHFVSATTGWVVGAAGYVWRSTDGGSTWSIQYPPSSSYLYSVRFFDAQTGWTVGDQGSISKTTNGGTNWTRSTSGTTAKMSGVAPLTASTAIVVADSGIILMTTNGGSTWNKIPSGTTNNLLTIYFINQSTGWIGGDAGVLLRTTDGGLTWTLLGKLGIYSYGVTSLQFIDASTGWAVVQYSGLYKTINGGLTWAKQTVATTQSLNCAYFVDAQTGWAGGSGGTILKTTTGGGAASFPPAATSPANRTLGISSSPTLTWSPCPGATSYNLQVSSSSSFYSFTVDASGLTSTTYALSTLGANRVLYWRVSAVYASGQSDWSPTWSFATGGTNWSAQISGNSDALNSVYFVDAQTGWAVGSYGAFLQTSNGGATWSSTNQSTYAYTWNSIHFLNSTTGWFAGAGGTIIKTTDGGGTWVKQTSGTTNVLNSIQFVDGSTGYAAGNGAVILKTQNGGTSWSVLSTGVTGKDFLSVTFANASKGWMVGTQGTILSTSDGGGTWTTQQSGTTNTLRHVHCITATNVQIAGDAGTILKSSDAGEHWISVVSGVTESLRDIRFPEPQLGWAVGDNSTVLKTTDGGESWGMQNPETQASLYSISFINSSTAWAVGANGAILRMSNGGGSILYPPSLVTPLAKTTGLSNQLTLTWNPVSQAISYQLQIASDPSFASYWIVTNQSSLSASSWSGSGLKTNAVYYWHVRCVSSQGTTPWSSTWSFATGGKDWKAQIGTCSRSLESVYFIDGNTGWVVGAAGTIMKTTDGGATWTDQSYVTSSSLYSVRFANSLSGWAVGGGGTILKTTDGGLSWAPQASGTTNDLYAVRFVDASSGWAVGSSGTILKTINGGAGWTTQLSGASRYLRGAHFFNSQVGWIAADTSMLKTIDGGGIWTSTRPTGSVYGLRGVWLIDSTFGYAVGGYGSLVKTTNGGATWESQQSGVSADLNSVQFENPSTGWISGGGQTILKTTNGGMSWGGLSAETESNFSDAWFVNSSTGWVIGSGGSILKTSNGGGPLFYVPVLHSPPSPSYGQPMNAILRWYGVPGSTSYRLQVSTSYDFSTPQIDKSNLIDTSYVLSGLTSYTSYYWRVNSTTSSGTSGWSSVWRFTVGSTTMGVPAAPILQSPSNSQINISLSPTISWYESSGTTSYRLQLSKNASFTSVVVDDSTLTTTSCKVGPLEQGTVYYWRVNAKNGYGSSAWSSYSRFTTTGTAVTVPLAPALVSPPTGVAGIPTSIPLTWLAAAGALSYRLQVSTNNTFSALIFDDSTLTVTEKAIGPLAKNTTYFWRVCAKNSAGASNWSPVWSFTTLVAGPVGPILYSPELSSGTVETSCMFRWMSSEGAVSYKIQVSTSALFSSNLVDKTLSDTSFRVSTLAPSMVYYWHVQAMDSSGAGNWSATWAFSTVGAGWRTSTIGGAYTSVCFVGSQYGWMAGTSGILATTNGGASWNKPAGAYSALDWICFVDSLTGWSAGWSGKIQKTTDGGATWISQTSGTTVSFVGVSMSDAYNGWVVSDGMILRTTNGGSSWQPQTAPVTQFIYGVRALSSTKGIVFGGNLILRTTNGGATWTSQPLPDYGFFLGGCFVDENAGWVVGADGVMFKTTDGGIQWSIASSGTTNWLTSIHFINAQQGWAVGWKGTIIKTTDAGATWGRQLSGITSSLNGVCFIDAATGWAVGAGKNMRTGDGGGLPHFPPSLLSPSPGAINISTQPTFQWNAAEGAVSYQLQVSMSSFVFSVPPVINDSALTSTTRQTSGLTPNRTYYWRILAYLADGTALCSPSWTFKTGTSSTSVGIINGLPTTYCLYQNYPNPFNPSTAIEFDVPKQSHVTLKVYNSLGNEVASLTASTLSPGRYRAMWDASNVSTGVYFCRMQAGEFVMTKKLILLK
jgi:photosystem II stability/assembly factor-like uncharacterized protein